MTNNDVNKNDINFDILYKLYERNMINVIGQILDEVSVACLLNLRDVSVLYRNLIDQDPKSMTRLEEAARWFSGQPLVIPVCDQPDSIQLHLFDGILGSMVTSLAANGDSIIFGLLGYDATVKIHSKNNLKLESTLVQSREFPASVSSVDFNEKLIATCAYESLNGAGSLHHAGKDFNTQSIFVWVYWYSLKFLLTASNDTTIAITDITNPTNPKLILRITDHKDNVSSLDCDRFNFVSVSVDNVLKVWEMGSWKCSPELAASSYRRSEHCPAMEQKGSLIRELRTGSNHGLSCLSMTWLPSRRAVNGQPRWRKKVCQDVYLVAGGNQGVISIWNTSVLLAGHPGNSPHRYIQVGGDGNNMISSLAVDGQSVMTGDWCGHVYRINFTR